MRDYRLCWQINRALKLDFVRQDEIKIHYKRKKKSAYFSLFIYEDETNMMDYFFMSNKHLGERLIPELRQVDYFMMIRGGHGLMKKRMIMEVLRENRSVEALFDSDPLELPSRQNLIFE